MREKREREQETNQEALTVLKKTRRNVYPQKGWVSNRRISWVGKRLSSLWQKSDNIGKKVKTTMTVRVLLLINASHMNKQSLVSNCHNSLSFISHNVRKREPPTAFTEQKSSLKLRRSVALQVWR